jgi:predicted dehydrogenase
LIRNGDLGAILGVNGVNHSENPGEHRAWFADPARAGGGAVMDHTVHLADLLRWYFAAEVQEVYAEVDNLFDQAGPADTAGLLLLTLSNGVQASIDCSWSRPASYPRWGHLKMDILGERGSAVMDSFAQYVTLYSPGSPRPVNWVGFGPDPNQAMIEEFVSSIREQRQPAVTWKDGYEALRVALAAYQSAQTNQPVRLEH